MAMTGTANQESAGVRRACRANERVTRVGWRRAMQAQSPKDGACRHRASEVKEGRDGKSESGQRLTGTWRSMHIPGPGWKPSPSKAGYPHSTGIQWLLSGNGDPDLLTLSQLTLGHQHVDLIESDPVCQIYVRGSWFR
jgi:hypothetical protein